MLYLMKKKIGLVIQGPLLSIGRAGNKLHESPEKLLREGGLVHYDCRPNIERLITDFGSLFDEIVVSTWDNELKPGDGWQGVKLISVPDPGGIKQPNSYKDNNKHRQFISTLNGLNELEKNGIDYAVKMRTDMYLDLKKLTESFFAGIESNKKPNIIYATVIHRPTFLLHDIYFAAHLRALKEFCEAILAYDKFEFMPSVHREIVLKPAHVLYKGAINVPDWAYFPMWPPDGISAATRKIFEYMFDNVFFALDPEVFRSTLWRGVYYDEDHVSGLVEVKDSRPRKYNLPGLVCTDWERYFHFRLQISGKKITFVAKIIIKIGKLGWKLWNLIRKVVRMVR